MLSPAARCFKAGMTPGMKVTKVNGAEMVDPGVRGSDDTSKETAGAPIDLVLQQGRRELRSRIEYHDGEKYPHLRRLEGKNDLLEKIIAPRGR